MRRPTQSYNIAGQGQQGVVLILGLIMVLLMTIVGLAAIRGTGLQETMAGNMRERTIAFQHAEAGLRVGEVWVGSNNIEANAFDGSVVGEYGDLGLEDSAVFTTRVRNWTPEQWQSRSRSSGLQLAGDSESGAPPRYLVERLDVLAQQAAEATGSGVDLGSLDATGIEIDMYRITAWGTSPSGSSDAVLQSGYRKN